MQKLTGFNGEFLLKAGTASLDMIGPQTETQGEYSVCKSRRQHQAEHCSSQMRISTMSFSTALLIWVVLREVESVIKYKIVSLVG